MSKKAVSSDYLRSRGLSEQEISVYSTILGLGSATIGEIRLMIKMKLPEIYMQIKQLEEIGYVKQIPGKVPRYIAMEPFLKDYAKLSTDVRIGLVNIQKSFGVQVEEFNTKIQTIVPGLSDSCDREREECNKKIEKRFEVLEENLNKLIDNSFIQIKHVASNMSAWPSECIAKTIPAFESDLEQSKDEFVSTISQYADSLVVDSREIRERLSKSTLQHKILVSERLEKLKSDTEETLTKFQEKLVKQNNATAVDYASKLDEKDIAIREKAAEIITELVNNVVTLARMKEGDISSDTAQMVNNSLEPLFRTFDLLQKEVANTLETVLDENNEQVTILTRQAKGAIASLIPEVQEVVNNHLEESRDESAKFIDKKITEPFKNLEKMKGDISQDILIFKKNIEKEAAAQDANAQTTLAEKVARAQERFELGRVEIKDTFGLARIDIEDTLQSMVKNIINTNTNKINETTEIMENVRTKLENTLANTIFLLEDSGKTFDGIVNMSDKVMPMDELEVDIIYGNESIERSMKDILLRTQEELTLITPTIIKDYLYEIEKLPQMTNYQIISKIEEEDVGLLTQLIKRGNVTSLNYKGKDFWVAIRDNEEILFAPKVHKQKNIAFITTNPKYFKLFFELVKQKVFSKMKAENLE